MAFVWSRLALAAVLAVGGASPAVASTAARCDEAPRLACSTPCPSLCIVADLPGDADDGACDQPLVAPAAIDTAASRASASDVLPPAPIAAPARVRDVLEIAPKTSPPRA